MKNIILIVTLLIFAGCSNDDNKETNTKQEVKDIKQLPQKPKSKVLNDIAASRKAQANIVKTKKEVIPSKKIEVPKKIETPKKLNVTKPKIEELKVEKVKAVEKLIVEKTIVEEKIQEIKQDIKEEPVKVVQTGKSGAEIFKACTACHGTNADKAALGRSKIIKGWSADKTLNALNGYKDGTYGGAMKGLMKGQADFLNDEEMKKVSEYISKL